MTAVAFAVLWVVFLSSDECGNEDNIECTPLGWLLLVTWMVLGVSVVLLTIWSLARMARPGPE